jgi:isocitrate dehydrogenase
MAKTPITVAYGDGIGPEIMTQTLRILEAAGAEIQPEIIEIGKAVYERGIATGIEESSWESLRRTKVFLKAPVTTPQGGGFKSLNVTTRKALGLYANVRPVEAYAPYVDTRFPNLNLVIVRENEEDLYAGIEHRQTRDVYQSLKLISRPGCEKIVRYAFEYARAYKRPKVTCMTKDNIMKMTDGLFHKVFDEIGAEYPEIKKEHWIIDIGSALLADDPERFSVIVTLNLYGDIISDIAAQVAGSVGMGGSANIGNQCAMFEAIHGSAPDITGKGIANPSGLLQGAIQMLVHIGQVEVAAKIQNAWLCTIEDGFHTGDIYKEGISTEKVGTQGFGDAVIARLGKNPTHFKSVSYASAPKPYHGQTEKAVKPVKKKLVGSDIFIEWSAGKADLLGETITGLDLAGFQLAMISNRGIAVWPGGHPETFTVDHWRLRFVSTKGEGQKMSPHALLRLMRNLLKAGFETVKSENLYYFDNQAGYSKDQG